MERPQAEWLIEFLEKAGKLKSVPRHCITPEGVRGNGRGTLLESFSDGVEAVERGIAGCRYGKGNPYVSAARSRRSGNGRYPCI